MRAERDEKSNEEDRVAIEKIEREKAKDRKAAAAKKRLEAQQKSPPTDLSSHRKGVPIDPNKKNPGWDDLK